MIQEPKPPSGWSTEAAWFRQLLEWCKCWRVLQIEGYREEQTTSGRKFKRTFKLASPQIISPLAQFKFVSDGGDYYICNTWDGTTQGTTPINVAKPYPLRCILPSATPTGGAIDSATIDGVDYSYSYAPQTVDGVTAYYYRTTTWAGGSEVEAVVPYLLPGDIIMADYFSFNGSPQTLGGVAATKTTPAVPNVTWLARADGRAWSTPP